MKASRWPVAGFVVYLLAGVVLSGLRYATLEDHNYSDMFMILFAPWYGLIYGLAGAAVGYQYYRRAYLSAAAVSVIGALVIVATVPVIRL
ncbi:MAG: hypothetical protein JWP72_1389 [Massilia sp.]|nr:hypothetical protein [Massilia sp.]